MSDPLLTLDEVADRLHLPASQNRARTVRRLIRDKAAPFKKIGRAVYLTQAQFEVLFERLTCSPSAKKETLGTSGASSKGRGGKKSTSLSSAQDAITNAMRGPTQTSSNAKPKRGSSSASSLPNLVKLPVSSVTP